MIYSANNINIPEGALVIEYYDCDVKKFIFDAFSFDFDIFVVKNTATGFNLHGESSFYITVHLDNQKRFIEKYQTLEEIFMKYRGMTIDDLPETVQTVFRSYLDAPLTVMHENRENKMQTSRAKDVFYI